MALLGVVLHFLLLVFLNLVPDHHQTWASAVASRPLTKDTKKYVLRVGAAGNPMLGSRRPSHISTDRSRGSSTGVGPLVLKIPPFASGQRGILGPPVEESGTDPGQRWTPG